VSTQEAAAAAENTLDKEAFKDACASENKIISNVKRPGKANLVSFNVNSLYI